VAEEDDDLDFDCRPELEEEGELIELNELSRELVPVENPDVVEEEGEDAMSGRMGGGKFLMISKFGVF